LFALHFDAFCCVPLQAGSKKGASKLHAPFSLGMHPCIDASVTDKN